MTVALVAAVAALTWAATLALVIHLRDRVERLEHLADRHHELEQLEQQAARENRVLAHPDVIELLSSIRHNTQPTTNHPQGGESP